MAADIPVLAKDCFPLCMQASLRLPRPLVKGFTT